MTAEVIIMNKSAIAIAADSAVTIGPKIYKTFNKVFMLSKYEPIGIMIYDNANLMGMPWETIIKLYREELNETRYDTVEQYFNGLKDFIEKFEYFIEAKQKSFFRDIIKTKMDKIFDELGMNKPGKSQLFNFLHSLLLEGHETELNQIKDVDRFRYIADLYINQILEQTLENVKDNWGKIDPKFIIDIYENYRGIIEEELFLFEKVDLFERTRFKLKKIAAYSFYEITSGIVITGFGDIEIFPSAYSYVIGGIINNNLKCKQTKASGINQLDSAEIIPFAQNEMVELFLKGVNDDYKDITENTLDEIINSYPQRIMKYLDSLNNDDIDLDEIKNAIKEVETENENLKKAYIQNMDLLMEERYESGIKKAISVLPKDEMAAMAEALIHLTSIKRKYSYGQKESVGGEIDVAVISKTDGFIWIKRKHYFSPKLNHHFFHNYYRHANDDKMDPED